MNTLTRTFHIARRSLALSALLGIGLVAHAQQVAVPAATTSEPTLNFQLPAAAPDATFSSSSENNEVAVAENHFDFLAAAQPPSRGRYSRPRYRGSNTNADGSNKYTFLAGAGFTIPTSDLSNNNTTSWGIQVGAGRNFNKTFGVVFQFDYDKFGVNNRTLSDQLAIYDSPEVYGPGAITQLDGNSHIWSFTLNPVINIPTNGSLGAYVVGGVGFYHKTTAFTVPIQEEDEFRDVFQADQTFPGGSYTSNAPGFNGGFGLTYKISRFSNERLYGEVRYVYVDSQQKAGFTIANIGSATATATNFYPANSNHSTYIPVKFGVRF